MLRLCLVDQWSFSRKQRGAVVTVWARQYCDLEAQINRLMVSRTELQQS